MRSVNVIMIDEKMSHKKLDSRKINKSEMFNNLHYAQLSTNLIHRTSHGKRVA